MSKESGFILNKMHTDFFFLLRKYENKKRSIAEIARKGERTGLWAYNTVDKLEDIGLVWIEEGKGKKAVLISDKGKEVLDLISKLKFKLIK